jgi:signal recognition particle receptor subunit beta
MSATYKAAKNRSQGREGWCALFRHPLRSDKQGKPLRIRKGLRTKDDTEADRLIEELNTLLQDQSYWSLSEKGRATREFDPRVVSIFYEDIEARAFADPWADREAEIPMPGQEEGYSRVQLVGTTGAGKTTLLRQLIGTDPTRDRFPSTSTAKTTTFDIEIFCAEGPYRAAVSFLSRERVRLYIEECVTAAVTAAAEGAVDNVVLKHLLEHDDQRFRLSYVLGTLKSLNVDSDEREDLTDEDDGEDDTDIRDDEFLEISEDERSAIETRLRSFLERTIAVGRNLSKTSADTLGVTVEKLAPADRDAFIEVVEDALREDEDAQTLIDEILDEVELRFTSLGDGRTDEWPTVWKTETADRAEFIRTINRFSSNYAPNFGRLLTPMVQGIRVAGPFSPDWYANQGIPKLVLIDGEGLGHTSDSGFSLPTSITQRYDSVNVILLVDNATQPMQAGAQAVLRSVAVSGHGPKLAVVCTHFDQVKGDNLPNLRAKKEHVSASINNAIVGIEAAFGDGAGKALRRHLDGKIFFVSKIQEKLPSGARFTRQELAGLTKGLLSAIQPTDVETALPIYDLGNLVLSVRKANVQFNDYWQARMKLNYKLGIDAEHWTRIKALSRRFAEQWNPPEYDTLRPVGDMIRFTSESMTSFINNPRAWRGNPPTEEAKQEAVEGVAREFFTRLHELAHKRLFLEHVAEWREAYDRRGKGSTLERARDMKYIYEDAAPVPGETPDPAANTLLDLVRNLFKQAADAAGAQVISFAMVEQEVDELSATTSTS